MRNLMQHRLRTRLYHIESFNQKFRAHLTRFPRLTAAHSKSVAHHEAMQDIYFFASTTSAGNMRQSSRPQRWLAGLLIGSGLFSNCWSVWHEPETDKAKGILDHPYDWPIYVWRSNDPFQITSAPKIPTVPNLAGGQKYLLTALQKSR
jgi:hypothetical protein